MAAAVAISSSSGEDLDTLVKQKNHMAILRHIRSHQLREPHLVIEHGKALLPFLDADGSTCYYGSTGTSITSMARNSILAIFSFMGVSLTEMDRLAVLEQMFMAALDTDQQALADQCLAHVKGILRSATGFNPDTSVRVRRLVALQKESQSDYDGAIQIYNALLEANPSNSQAIQRKYAVLKAQVGKEVEAMEAINTYLSYHQGDVAAWYELSNLCMNVANYQGATYCYEELVLMQPQEASLHCKLGELYVTSARGSSTLATLILARKHIALSLDLSDGAASQHNLRALYALVDTVYTYLHETNQSTAMTKKKKGTHQPQLTDERDIEVAKALLKFGVDGILKCYRDTSMFPIVKHVMDDYSQILSIEEDL
jgi:tetratricopeptide (TPR) repeat protein